MRRITFRDIINLFKKDVKTICLWVGGFYVVFGILALVMIKIQALMISTVNQQGEKEFIRSLEYIHDVWKVYMPFMILLGISYVLFGWLFERIKTNGFKWNLLLSVLSLIWALAYLISLLNNFDEFMAGFNIAGFATFKYVAYGFAMFGFLATLALFTIPQFFIGKTIKRSR